MHSSCVNIKFISYSDANNVIETLFKFTSFKISKWFRDMNCLQKVYKVILFLV